jgi:hypothetical protein
MEAIREEEVDLEMGVQGRASAPATPLRGSAHAERAGSGDGGGGGEATPRAEVAAEAASYNWLLAEEQVRFCRYRFSPTRVKIQGRAGVRTKVHCISVPLLLL